MRLLALGVLSFLVPCAAWAQSVDAIRWVTNGPVYAVAEFGGVTYIGGNFTMVSQATGCGVAPTTGGILPGGYPQVVGRINCVIPDGAGGWFIGGQFTSVGGEPRNNIARIASDQSLYPWNPDANDEVYSLALTGAGTIYVGGRFTTIGGQARFRLAEIDLNTGFATSLNIQMSSNVRALAATGNTMYVGGDYTNAGGTARSRLCAIDIPSRTLTAWNPGANGSVLTLEIATRLGPTTTILVGGSFSTLGGQVRFNLGEVFTNGAMSSWNPSPNGTVRDIHEHGTDYIVGDFTTIGGQPRNRAAAVDANGFVRPWNPDVSGSVETVVWWGSFVYLGGNFETVQGEARRNVVKVDDVAGIPEPFNPEPNLTVRGLAPGGPGRIYMGGDFTGLGGVSRRFLAAFDDFEGGPTSWDPSPNSAVNALALRTFGPELYTVYAGGVFTEVAGQPRMRMVAIHPKTGLPTAWTADADDIVYSITLNDTMVAFGGNFSSVNGTPANRLAAVPHTPGGPVTAFSGTNPLPSSVFAVALGGSTVFVGGQFGYSTYDLPTHNQTAYQNPSVNGTVRAIFLRSYAYLGGDFTTVGGSPRNRIARVAGTTLDMTWNPGADGVVRAFAQGETGLLVGGDFTNIAGAPRGRLAQLDLSTGAAQPWIADASHREVWAIDASGPHVRVGGTFHGFGAFPQGNFAALGPPRVQLCTGAPFGSFVGARPKALAVLDYDLDGKDDVAVCQDYGNVHVMIMKGGGNGAFGFGQVLDPATAPRDIAVGDFDFDGRPDLAITEEGDAVGVLSLYRNNAGTFEPWVSTPLPGRADGLAVADMDADGILDVAVCLTDSAEVLRRGGLQVLRGGGTNGIWDGTFTLSLKSPADVWQSVGRKVLAQDFNDDGYVDFAYTGVNNSSVLELHMGPDLEVVCRTVTNVSVPAGNSGVAIAAGDMNEDGRTDVVSCRGRNLSIRYKSADPGCTLWFPTVGSFVLPLPSTPRDIAVLDFDQDGILDVLCAFDSLSTLAWCRGGGESGIADGTLLPPVDLVSRDVYAIGIGDFLQDGNADVVTSMAICGQLGVLPSGSLPQLPITITLDAPNGGEGWSEAALVPLPPAESARVVSLPGLEEMEMLASPAPSRVASLQAIQWTKGAGIAGGVDVELSRNDGQTWRAIGKNVPGTSMNWVVTPPGTGLARIRVRDTVYRARADASDAPFAIFAGVTGAEDGPVRSGLRLLGANPTRVGTRFALDVASPAPVAVVLYDAAGRRVRVLANGTYRAGTHDLTWDGRNERGLNCRSGVYFVKARIGGVETTRKVVML